jgi:hypothetical protein
MSETQMEGQVVLYVDLKVSMAEFSTWDTERVRKFLLGLVQVYDAVYDKVGGKER